MSCMHNQSLSSLLLVLTKFSFEVDDWAPRYNPMEFLDFPDIS